MFSTDGRRARRSDAKIWGLIPAARVRLGSGCKEGFDQLLFSCLALRRSQDFRHQCSTGSSFRAFRFATRWPGGGRQRRLSEAQPPLCSYFFRRSSMASSKRRVLVMRVFLESSLNGSTSSLAREETNLFRFTSWCSPKTLHPTFYSLRSYYICTISFGVLLDKWCLGGILQVHP